MQETKRRITARSILEGGVFALLAGVTVASAIQAKQASARGETALPSLAQLTPVAQHAPAKPQVVATREATAETPAGFTTFKVEEISEELADANTRFFDGRMIRPVRTITMVVTAYSPDHRSCGKWADGFTASNKSVWTNGMKLVAADTSLLPFGTLLSIPGYDNGAVVPVLDRGGAIKGARLDVLYPTHEVALKWGVQRLPVTVWEYAD